MSVQCNFVRSQQPREMLAPKKRVFVFALDRQRVEADQGFVDEPRVTHDEAILRKLIEKLSHQHAEIGLLRKIIGTGEARIECDIGARGPATKFGARPNSSLKAANCTISSARMISESSECSRPARSSFGNPKNMPPSSGRKCMVKGRNGAV